MKNEIGEDETLNAISWYTCCPQVHNLARLISQCGKDPSNKIEPKKFMAVISSKNSIRWLSHSCESSQVIAKSQYSLRPDQFVLFLIKTIVWKRVVESRYTDR